MTSPPTAPVEKPNRIHSLDSIRGLAALAVLLGHILGAFSWPHHLVAWTQLPLINIFFDGRSAVTMFLVLSGFVLAAPYVRNTEKSKVRNLRVPTFLLRRVIRIWLPWLAVFCMSAVAQKFLYAPPETIPRFVTGDLFWIHELDLGSMLRQCVFALKDPARQLLPQDWTLRVELIAACLMPLFVLLSRWHTGWLIGCGGLLLIRLPTGSYYVSFILGVLVARFDGPLRLRFQHLRRAGWWVLVSAGLLLYQSRLFFGYFTEISTWLDQLIWCIGSLGCGVIIFCSISGETIKSLLEHPALLFLGKISYSVYLIQFLVILLILPSLVAGLNALGINSPVLLMPATVVVALMCTVGAALLLFQAVELPSMRLGYILSEQIKRTR